MPPRTRKSPDPADAQPQACPICFPAGFPEGVFSLGCEHGTFTAAVAEKNLEPAATPESPAEPTE